MHSKTILMVISLMLLVSRVEGQQAAYRPTVMIDIEKLSEPSRAAVVISLIKLKPFREWEPVIVRQGDSLSAIIYNTYGYSTTKYPETTAALTKSIVEANSLDDTKSLKAGDEIRVPALPSRPYARGAQKKLAQVLDLIANKVFLAAVSEIVASPSRSVPELQKDLALGDSWLVKMSPTDNELFLAGLPASIRDEIVGDELYTGPTTEVREFNVPDFSDISSVHQPARAAADDLAKFLSGVDPAVAGKLYILDFFKAEGSQECTHGDMVFDVAKQTLEGYGASQLVGNIKPIQIDFFENKETASAIIREYIASFPSEKIQKNLTSALNNLREQKKPKPEKKYVPLLYLQALYHNLTTKADSVVVSSSFFLRADGYRVIPTEYRQDSKVALVSAVMDDSGSKVEESLTEPQKSFYEGRRDFGVILVGAEKEPGVSYGMISQSGDGVTCLARGVGWGTDNSCITPQRIGTSFSTPSVSVQLFLARAFWSANEMNISAREAKVRLLLASDLNPAYVNSYASGGIPRLEKLLRPNGAFAEMSDGTIRSISLADSFIDVISASGGIPDRFNFQRGTKGACGVQVVEGRIFIFREAAMRWEEVQVVSFSFTITENGTTRSLTLEEFKNNYKEIAVL